MITALDEAAAENKGYFDPKEECTLPAQASNIQQSAKQMTALDPGSSTATAVAASAAATAIWKSYDRIYVNESYWSSPAVVAFAYIDREKVSDTRRKLRAMEKTRLKLQSVAKERKAADRAAKKEARVGLPKQPSEEGLLRRKRNEKLTETELASRVRLTQTRATQVAVAMHPAE